MPSIPVKLTFHLRLNLRQLIKLKRQLVTNGALQKNCQLRQNDDIQMLTEIKRLSLCIEPTSSVMPIKCQTLNIISETFN